jgi:hypothetical protein
MYFNLSQVQYLGLAILGGLLLIAVLVLAFLGHRMVPREEEKKTTKGEAAGDHEFPDGLKEGHRPVPVGILLLVAAMIIWGIGYTLAYAFGVFYAQ